MTQFDGHVLQSSAFFVSSLCNLGSLVVTNVRVEGGDKHEGLVEDVVDLLTVSRHVCNAVKVKRLARISKQGNGVENITDDERLEDVKLKVTI